MPAKRFLFLFSFLQFAFSPVKSQTYDNLQVSLLTVDPHSKAIWTNWGHTALRLSDPEKKIDAVLNWGTFDTTRPNFIMRFVEGKTDYYLSTAPFQHVIYNHDVEKATVTEQILNIPDSLKGELLQFVLTNLAPQNREYRYSFLFDNCTTRPRDIIEKFCGGTLVYPEQTQPVTLRELFLRDVEQHPWLTFGIDCAMGSGADSLISYHSELFLPVKLMDALDHSVVICGAGAEHPVVLSSKVILQNDSKPVENYSWNHPVAVGFTIFILYLLLCILSLRAKRNGFRIPFALIFFIAGAGGCVVAMLNFFSVHPCVQHNWNLLWLHPLHFIAFVGFCLPKTYRWVLWYHAVNFVLLSGFLSGWYFIPQKLNVACIPFALCLWVVSGLQLVILKRGQNE